MEQAIMSKVEKEIIYDFQTKRRKKIGIVILRRKKKCGI